MEDDAVVLHVRGGELEVEESWVYVWLTKGAASVVYVGSTGIPPAARAWLHLHNQDPDVGRIAARLPAPMLKYLDVLAFPVPQPVERGGVKLALIELLATRKLLAGAYVGEPPTGNTARARSRAEAERITDTVDAFIRDRKD